MTRISEKGLHSCWNCTLTKTHGNPVSSPTYLKWQSLTRATNQIIVPEFRSSRACSEVERQRALNSEGLPWESSFRSHSHNEDYQPWAVSSWLPTLEYTASPCPFLTPTFMSSATVPMIYLDPTGRKVRSVALGASTNH